MDMRKWESFRVSMSLYIQPKMWKSEICETLTNVLHSECYIEQCRILEDVDLAFDKIWQTHLPPSIPLGSLNSRRFRTMVGITSRQRRPGPWFWLGSIEMWTERHRYGIQKSTKFVVLEIPSFHRVSCDTIWPCKSWAVLGLSEMSHGQSWTMPCWRTLSNCVSYTDMSPSLISYDIFYHHQMFHSNHSQIIGHWWYHVIPISPEFLACIPSLGISGS